MKLSWVVKTYARCAAAQLQHSKTLASIKLRSSLIVTVILALRANITKAFVICCAAANNKTSRKTALITVRSTVISNVIGACGPYN